MSENKDNVTEIKPRAERRREEKAEVKLTKEQEKAKADFEKGFQKFLDDWMTKMSPVQQARIIYETVVLTQTLHNHTFAKEKTNIQIVKP